MFLTSTAAFAAGSAIPGRIAGAVLVGYTGLAVAGIGIALFPVLRPHGAGLAVAYAVLRCAECLVLLGIVGYAMLLAGVALGLSDVDAGIVFLVGIADLFTAAGSPRALARIEAFGGVWDLGLVLVGVHLVLVGYLASRSRNVPTVLGVLVAVAGLGYVVDGAATVLVTG